MKKKSLVLSIILAMVLQISMPTLDIFKKYVNNSVSAAEQEYIPRLENGQVIYEGGENERPVEEIEEPEMVEFNKKDFNVKLKELSFVPKEEGVDTKGFYLDGFSKKGWKNIKL